MQQKPIFLGIIATGVITMVAIALIFTSLPTIPDDSTTQTTTQTTIDLMDGAKAAVYTDRGIRASSRAALVSMFEWMGADVTIIDESVILNGTLGNYDIIVMPGGCWCTERCEILGSLAKNAIRQFIANGGAYFGIDGGASYATAWRLDIFHGTFWPDSNGSETYLLEVNVNTNSMQPDLSDEQESYTLLYEASGYFEAVNMTGITPICTYTDTGLPCMISFDYGNGRVFLSSPHPEYEEGSMRDNVETWDTLTDPDSEWDFMFRICNWLLEGANT